MNPAHAKAATELLAFYLEAGVDALVGDAPVDRLAAGGADEQASVAAPAPARAPSPSPSLRQPAAGDAEKTAR
ncbi:MAG: uracil-DNA glycosylase, partial [Rhodoplanes sp.]